MPHHCKFCGATLDEDEEANEEKVGMYVCHDCMHHGFTMLENVLGKMKADHEQG